jgi:hypothetical protein
MGQPFQTLVELLYHCTVRVDVNESPKGTGFFVAPSVILTCAHVVKGDLEQKPTTSSVKVQWNGQRYSVQVKEFLPNPYPDLALLDTDGLAGHPCVYLDSDVQHEDKLYSYGYTEGYPNGDPAYFDYEGLSHGPDFLKLMNAQARPGLSGAPLLNRRTKAVCGIVKKTRDQFVDLGGYAVPTATILSCFPALVQSQSACHQQDRRWVEIRQEEGGEVDKVAPSSAMPKDTSLSLGERQRLQQDLNRLADRRNRLNEKARRLERAVDMETDPLRSFQYEEQLRSTQVSLADIDQEMKITEERMQA